MKIILITTCLYAALSMTGLTREGEKRVNINEDKLCQQLEGTYNCVKAAENDKGLLLDVQVERLSYIVLVAGARSNGSKRLDAILSRIQKESPFLVVPSYIMTPAELDEFIAMAGDDKNDYRLRMLRYMSEWIDKAKKAITQRSGFKFDPSVLVKGAQ